MKANLYDGHNYHPKIKTAVKKWKDGEALPLGYRDHQLHKDQYNKDLYDKKLDNVRGDLREFHVNGNYVVVYKKYDDGVYLIELLRAGKHKDVLHTSVNLITE